MSLRRPRPDRMAAAHEHVAEAPVSGARELMAARERPHPRHVGQLRRFRWASAGLFLLALISLALAVILSGTSTRDAGSGGSWSVWRPPDPGLAGAQEIADYVAPNYEASPSRQLAIVTVVNLNNPSAPVQVVLPASPTSGGLVPLPAGNTIVYNLCGLATPNCSIGSGHASAARFLLLRLEALELALYTFKYISGTQTVVTILPPGYATGTCTGICAKPPQTPPVKTRQDVAVAFDRAELQTWLAMPLRETLTEGIAPTPGQMPAAEARIVRIVTAHGLFSENFAQGQDGSTLITLSPMAPQ